jgi:hypothetical protein
VLGAGWLRIITDTPGRLGLTLPSTGENNFPFHPPQPNGLEVCSCVYRTLRTRLPQTMWLKTGPSFSSSVEDLGVSELGAGMRMETPPFLPLSTCSSLRAASLSSSHLLQQRYLPVWLPPQLQHLSCCFDVAQDPAGCGSLQATHLSAQPLLPCSFVALYLCVKSSC